MREHDRPKRDFEVLYFFVDWTGAHAVQGPEVERLQTPEGVKLRSIDLEESAELAERYEVEHLPTFIMLRQEREVGRLVGMYSAEEIEGHIAALRR